MRILFVSPFLPYPPVAGGHRQIWTWMTRLSRTHKTAFVGFYEREAEQGNVAEVARLCAVTRARLRQPTPHAYCSFAQTPRWVSEYWSDELAQDIREVAAEFRPGVVQFLHTNMGQYARCFAGMGTGFVKPAMVVTALDIGFVSQRRYIAEGEGRRGGWAGDPVVERLQSRLEWLRMLRYEAALFRRADHVITVSEHDSGVVRAVAKHSRVTAVPPGVEREQLAARTRRPESGRVLYVGHMEHSPNLYGLMSLYSQIWPIVTKEFAAAKLSIAGTGTREELGRVAPKMLARMESDPSVEIMGFVPDLGGLMDRCAVMAAPMQVGSGVRNKVIEAMAAGLPVVTTTLGAEGLAVEHERELLIVDRDDGEAFARELVRLLKDESLQARLSAAGRELAVREHDNDRILKRLEHALMRAVGERGCAAFTNTAPRGRT
ncbi:MAG: glycosyltransferase family 4 protein [Armatimonadota bacterium]